ncbi:MAG: CARDB domain-containing protein [Candidatus Limnocylindria bacterium]
MPKRVFTCLLTLAFVATVLLAGPGPQAAATPVADTDALYELYGRVFPDPHGCVRGLPGKSPYAKGNVCATQFIQFDEVVAGLRFLDGKFPSLMEIYELPWRSAGIPTTTLEREASPLYAVRVTDESQGGEKKKFAFALSIHGIERAAVEGGTRAIEDLVTWGTQEPERVLLGETIPESTLTVAEALASSEIWFFYPNPDGWVRGDVSRGGLMYQRYGGNGVDLNRDWPTSGYTFRPYTPGSEPETKAFMDFLGARRGGWAGTADLHGMLDAIAFTFTMLPAGQFDYAKNAAVVQSVRRIQEDAFPRLSWFPLIRPYDQTPTSTRPHAQQWGTIWDTINYTVTGSLGDWMANPIGLDATVGIDNEMWFSHLAPNNVFEPDLEQAHIDGNKGLIYAQIESAFRESSRTFPYGGSLAYVDHGRVFSHSGSDGGGDAFPGTRPQSDRDEDLVSPTTEGTLSPTFEFDVFGPSDGVRNGGIDVRITYSNVDGVSLADVITSAYLERFGDAHGEKEWEVVGYHWNQQQPYAAAGHTIAVNDPIPGRYRIRLDQAPPGIHHVDIDFTEGQAWPDPGQEPYSVTNVEFFEELRPYLADGGSISRLTPEDILAGASLDAFDTIVLPHEALAGWYDPAPTGPTQPDETFTAVAPVPEVSQVMHEFDVLPEFNNVAMVVRIEWDVPSDYDLYLERQTPSGAWVEIGSSLNFINTGEQVEISGMLPGHYRARVVNFLGAPQEVRGSVDFRDSGITPAEHPVTRTEEERDAYFAALRAFVEAGGNLVLTDGAARGLPHLGVGEPKDVRPLLVFAPYIGFTTDGTNETYADPLARNVDQPGAAEGPGHRHQTVEPVPLGYAIQDLDGNNTGHSFTWTVSPEAWSAAGGRVVGTAAGGVALGEIALGAGRIRLLGAALPEPEVRYDHPYGLASYALTYTGWQLIENVVQWTRPLPDLALAPGDITLSIERVRGGDQVTITANVRNIGEGPALNVPVRFTDNGEQIGDVQTIAEIPAGGAGSASVIWDTRAENGEHTITVTADPASVIRELDETNNEASITVLVRGNRVQNGSFEDDTDADGRPDGWTPAGGTSYERDDEDADGDGGRGHVTADATGTWTSDPIEVVAGTSYEVAVEAAGGTLRVEQLSATGLVLEALSGVTGFTAAADVTHVRIVLTGDLLGTATFDNVGLWEE